jgi:hypothetical protein
VELRVPVTARLSRRFYEVLGEDVADELVDWFNAVDLTHRAELRALNKVNFALGIEIAGRRPEFRTELQRVRAELVFTMFVFWVLNLVGTAGLVIVLGWH